MVDLRDISSDFDAHNRYAHDQQQVEEFQKQYHLTLSGAGAIAIQTRVLDVTPKYPAIVRLMQTDQRKTWAFFGVPKNFFNQRGASSYIAPSLGSYERLTSDHHKLEAFVKSTKGKQRPAERGAEDKLSREAETLGQLIDLGIIKTNQEIDYIKSRMKQFLQG